MALQAATSVEESSEDVSMRQLPGDMISALSPIQAGFFISIITIPDDFNSDALRARIAEVFSPSHLFDK